MKTVHRAISFRVTNYEKKSMYFAAVAESCEIGSSRAGEGRIVWVSSVAELIRADADATATWVLESFGAGRQLEFHFGMDE